MNHHKYQIYYKNICFLVTLVSTAIISSSAFATSRAEILSPNRQIDRSLSHKTIDRAIAPSFKLNPAQPQRPAVNQQIAQASDVTGNWAEPFIKVLVEKGIIAGYPDGSFRPDQPVTRAEFAALLTKAFSLAPTKRSSHILGCIATIMGGTSHRESLSRGLFGRLSQQYLRT
jgi:hypothetical protein